MSTEAGVSMTGNPSRLALAATPLSGVAGMPESASPGAGPGFGAGDPAWLFGAAGAAPAGCGCFTLPRLIGRRPETLICGSFFWSAADSPADGPLAAGGPADGAAVCAVAVSVAASAVITKAEAERRKKKRAEVRPPSRPRLMTGSTLRPNGEERPVTAILVEWRSHSPVWGP
ncbi:MAG TPA: hypothetical protein VMC05_08875 [Xanthobacteraceae bacterium]|nr:hypothetical protein [Xanthobacteraceae bacterium]